MAEQVNKSIIVKGEVEDIYPLWANFENFPDFMKPIKSVKKTGERTSHWVMQGPSQQEIEWDVETTTLEQDKRIAWNSTGGDVKTTGQVVFTQLPDKQTQISVTLQYAPQDGVSGAIRGPLFDDPQGQLLENLRGFKKYAEEKYDGKK